MIDHAAGAEACSRHGLAVGNPDACSDLAARRESRVDRSG
jgi:hypothetical protein